MFFVLVIESVPLRVLAILAVAVLSHLLVIAIRRLVRYLVSREFAQQHPRMRSVASLFASVSIFAVYFAAVGFMLSEFGISLTAYLASATVIGLAVGFGSQGLVQDVVTGLTVVFSNLIDVGEMIEIAGQAGTVKSIGMRFIVIENALGARVYIPNRTIGNVMKYPQGYVRCQVDILLPGDEELSHGVQKMVERHMRAAVERFPSIHVREPSREGVHETEAGNRYLRIKFRIWPGRGNLIETAFRQELIKALQQIDETYADWMVSILYEVEKR